jgi:hypothetical protein
MTGYDTAGWGDLLACAGGAAAALAGLIFVGLSVNMSTLLDLDHKRGQNFLTGRALEALVAMLNILVICIVTLTPHILKGVLAAFISLTAVASAISPVRAAGHGGGLFWLPAAFVIAIVVASVNSWVLLVEVLR